MTSSAPTLPAVEAHPTAVVVGDRLPMDPDVCDRIPAGAILATPTVALPRLGATPCAIATVTEVFHGDDDIVRITVDLVAESLPFDPHDPEDPVVILARQEA